MNKVLGAKFRTSARVYYFGPGDIDVHLGDRVVVETARGTEVATVVMPIREIEDDKVPNPFRTIKRIATEEDLDKCMKCRDKEVEAAKVCKQKIADHGLEMKLVRTECAFDGAKMIFYFTADGRVDFRELVKDLASVYHTRIELRQIGVRDETRLMGGFGVCGRPVCCATYLSEFQPVSIKMAKEQNLSLNPSKISGLCGRLMCCLKNENETYEYLNSRLPKVGETVGTPDGHQGQVKSNNVLRQLVKVIIEEDDIKEEREYKAEDLKFKRRPMKKSSDKKDKKVNDEPLPDSEDELKKLAELEGDE